MRAIKPADADTPEERLTAIVAVLGLSREEVIEVAVEAMYHAMRTGKIIATRATTQN